MPASCVLSHFWARSLPTVCAATAVGLTALGLHGQARKSRNGATGCLSLTTNVAGSGASVDATPKSMYAGPWLTLRRRSKLFCHDTASMAVPSWNFTPWRKWKV